MNEHPPLCPDCFHDKDHVQICPHCGWDDSEAPIETVLKPGTSLHHGQYLIGRVLGKPGGFGITYLGFDTRLEIKVAIKEYFPRECIRKHDHATVSAPTTEAKEFRVALDGFMKEARTVAKLKHANIVRVNNFFEENGTGYLVMDYYEGLTLAEYLQPKGGKLTEPTALAILMPILDGLREAHQAGILHRDIKPQNIYLTTGNQPILLDFGAARPIVRRDASLQATIGLYTPGYSPFEQQMTNGKQGPWTDVYASAATLYHMVTGECPPPAGDRILYGDTLIDPTEYRVTAKLSAILVKALAVKPEGRYQSIREFQAMLLSEGAVAPKEEPVRPAVETPAAPSPVPPSPAVTPTAPATAKGRPPGWAWGLGGLSVVGLIFVLTGKWGGDPAMVLIPGKNYELGTYEVTQKEWREVMGSNPSRFSSCGDVCPVESVSWNDIQEFFRKLNARTGKQYRLPTEAEWEYACYGGNQTKYCGGNDPDAVAWYDKNSGITTHPVGQKQANGFGLYDMSGNVWEWMQDESNGGRALRGGSWGDGLDSYYLRAAFRGIFADPMSRGNGYGHDGFRVARTLP